MWKKRVSSLSSTAAAAGSCRPGASWPHYALVGGVSIACYLNGLHGEFVHDDIPAVVLNKDVLAANPLMDVFDNDFWGTPMADLHSHKSYRPLTTLTFRANYLLVGLNPFWFHLTNVLLHALATLLFTRVCLHVADLRPSFATLAGLMFAVHPIHTEAVTGVVGRADVLAGVFFLLSLLAYHGTQRCYLWTSILTGGLSILAKETGITVFLVNVMFDFYRGFPQIKRTSLDVRWSTETRQFVKRTAIVLTSCGILIAIRLALLQGSLPRFSQGDNPAAFHPSLLVRIMTFSYLAAFNWWLLICPANLSHDWQMGSVPLVTHVVDARNLVTCLFLAAAVGLLVKSAADAERHKSVTVVLGLLLLVLPFLPAANLVVTVGFVIAERVLYIPSLGFILLTVSGMQTLWSAAAPKHRQTLASILLLLLAAQTWQCVARNKDWRSRESLLRAGLRTLPHNAKMHYNFANFLRDSDHNEMAMAHYYTALRLWPTYASAHNNLGTLLKSHDEAEKHFLLAIKYNKEHLNAHYNLGQLYRKMNRTMESETMLMKAIAISENFTLAYVELMRLKGPNDRNIAQLLRKLVGLSADPEYAIIYAQWLEKKGNQALALRHYLRALAAYRSNSAAAALTGAGGCLRRIGARSRLLQLITRYQTIQRLKRGELITHPDVYLQRWYLQHELKKHADDYGYMQLVTQHGGGGGGSTTASHAPPHPAPPSKRIKNIKRNKTMFSKNAHHHHIKFAKNCYTPDIHRIFVTASPQPSPETPFC